jgi:hypothetical protein
MSEATLAAPVEAEEVTDGAFHRAFKRDLLNPSELRLLRLIVALKEAGVSADVAAEVASRIVFQR